MGEFERQTEIMDMKEEMMSDAVDEALGDVGEEEETDAIVQKVTSSNTHFLTVVPGSWRAGYSNGWRSRQVADSRRFSANKSCHWYETTTSYCRVGCWQGASRSSGKSKTRIVLLLKTNRVSVLMFYYILPTDRECTLFVSLENKQSILFIPRFEISTPSLVYDLEGHDRQQKFFCPSLLPVH